jgi:hypothetical protein
MPRSVGITISAVVVFVGSAFTILIGAMMVLGSIFVSRLNRVPNIPAGLEYAVIVEAFFFFGFGGWGIATGVGLINTKEWARLSTLVFAAILLVISLSAALLIAFIQLPNSNTPNLPPNFMVTMRIAMAVFYGMFAALGVVWLYLLNKRSVKAQFRREQPAFPGVVPDLSVKGLGVEPSAGFKSRPISIAIIGWFLLLSSAMAPLFLVYYHALIPGAPLPMCFLGFFFFGRSAKVIFITSTTVQIIAALGLLKLKNWGRLATMGLQCLGIVNSLLLLGVPANRARFHQIMDSILASMNERMPQPVPLVFPVWMGIAVSLPIFLVILWFLVTRKQAFTSSR